MKYIITLLLFVTPLLAQVEQSRGSSPYKTYPGFFLDMTNYKGTIEGKTRVDLMLQLPFVNLQFIKKPKDYEAKFSIHIKFEEKNTDKIVIESKWIETITTETFAETENKSNFHYSYRKFDIEPGKYSLRCEVTDKDSKKNFIFEATANVLEHTDPVSVSDLLLISKIIKDQKGERIIPNIAKKVTTADSNVAFFYEIYSDTARDVHVRYYVTDKNEKEVFKEMHNYTLKEGTNKIFHSIDNEKFNLGPHKVYAEIKNDDFENIVITSKAFYSKIKGFPESIHDLDLAIEQMQYIASGSEIALIREAPNEELKIERFKEFWKMHDPSPYTEENEVFIEYYRRIEYANLHFGNYFKGWRSDMGMVYVTLGPPSAVERHPFDMGTKPYEIWEYYHLNRSFVFVDHTGFGDYRLTSSPYGEWFRYRQ
ncbi:MAG: GWxTD domain-containing protein [Ignavibacteria bacterium]|jgi:GWxTD domain-containing protein